MSESLTIRHLAGALAAELGAAINGGAVAVPSDAPALGPGWRLHATVTGQMKGQVVAWINVSGAEMLAQGGRGISGLVPGEEVAAILRDRWADIAAAVEANEQLSDVTVTAGQIEQGEADLDAMVYELRTSDGGVLVAIGGQVTVETPRASSAAANKLDVVLDIDLPLVIRFGRTQMTLRALSQVGPGSIIDMERSPDEPVQMLIGDQVIAHGEVVVVGGHYGVRVIDLVSAADRVRVLEG
jgi:flagellar motor switch protein FliN